MTSDYVRRAVEQRRKEREQAAAYTGEERRKNENISRLEFDNFVGCTTQYRVANNARLDRQEAKLDQVHLALFAKDDDNENGQRGLMHTAQRIEQHIDTVCKLARWARNSIVAIAGLIAAVGAAAKAVGVL